MGFSENDAWGTAWAEWCIKWLSKYKCCWRCRSGATDGTAYGRYKGQVQCNAKIEFDTVTTNTEAWHALYDIDAVVTLDCTGCPLLSTLDDGMHAKVTQYHEFKANKETHGGTYVTQNLAIEVIENTSKYNENIFGTLSDMGGYVKFEEGVWKENPLFHVEEQVRGGAGWWTKRDKVKRKDKDGNETIIEDDPLKHATWYHFIQMFDHGDVMEVSEETKRAFLEDDSISPDSALLRYYPVPYVVSVEGCYLEELIEINKNEYVKDCFLGFLKDRYGNRVKDKYGKYIEKRGYKVPVGDVIPANVFDLTSYSFVRKSGRLYNSEHVKVNLLSDRERKEGDRSLLVKKPLCNSPSKVYVPKEITDGLLVYSPLRPSLLRTSFEFLCERGYIPLDLKNTSLDEARMVIVEAEGMKNSFTSKPKKRGQIELLDFMADLIINRWCEVYPPDEQE